MAKLQTLTAIDPQTGARFTRKTARHYVAAIVVTTPNGLPTLVDASLCQQWASRPDLAQAALAKALRSEPTARLAPVVSPETEPQAQAAPKVAPASFDYSYKAAVWGCLYKGPRTPEPQAQAEPPHPCSAEGVAAEALAALAELGATPEPTPTPQAEALAEAQDDLALALAWDDLSPEALTEAQDDLALALAWDDLSPEALTEAQDDLALALAEPTPRPCLPGEALPPEPPAWGGPAPELPTLRPLRTPAELRADADSLQAEAAQALQALARIPALRRSAPDIRSMAQQLGDQAARLRGVAAAREAQAQARPLAPELPPLA